MSDKEKVLGGLEVEATLSMGSEHLFLLFTQTRLLLAHLVKVGRVSATFSLLLGKMSEGLKRVPRKGETLQKMAEFDPEEILGLDPDNFAVKYDQVVSLTTEPVDPRRSKITLLTTDQKIELYASPVAVEGLRGAIVSLLGGKARYKL